jgi:hypothetical protein
MSFESSMELTADLINQEDFKMESTKAVSQKENGLAAQ